MKYKDKPEALAPERRAYMRCIELLREDGKAGHIYCHLSRGRWMESSSSFQWVASGDEVAAALEWANGDAEKGP